MDEVLARSVIFQGVDPEAAEALAKEMDTIEVRKGDVVFNEGEAGDTLHVKVDGQINPPLFAGTSGAIFLYDGDRRLGRMPLSIKVFP